MADRPSITPPRSSATGVGGAPRWPWGFVAWAGLLGAAGVGIGAAAAHLGANDLARTASEFLLLHAAAIVAMSGLVLATRRTSALLVAALTLMAVGALLFGGELALAGLWNFRPLPVAAPTGGLCLIGGWLLLAVASLTLWSRG